MEEWINKIHCGDVLEILRRMPDEFVDCIITSPPYWGLRDYGIEGQIGLEPTLEEYLEKLLAVTAELKRVLKPTGVCFWNHASNYKNKCDTLQNYRLILRMVDEQDWILRNIIIWQKPNCMPSSAKDRFTNAYEPVFMLVKSQKYWFDLDAVRIPHRTNVSGLPEHLDRKEEIDNWRSHLSGPRNLHPAGRNPGDVWTIPTQPFPEAHFATFPERLVEPMIKAGCPQWICRKCGKARERIIENPKEEKFRYDCSSRQYAKAKHGEADYYRGITLGWTDCGCNAGWRPGIVLDPFMGSGTVAVVAERLNRWWIGVELNPEYIEMAYRRLKKIQKKLFGF